MSTAYRQGLFTFAAGELDWADAVDADVKIVPMNSSYIVDKDAHAFMDNIAITANIYSGVTAISIPSAQRSLDIAASGKCRLKVSGTVTFPSVAVDGTKTIPGFLVFKDTAVAATSPVIGYLLRSGGALLPNGNNIDVTFDGVSGALELTGNSI